MFLIIIISVIFLFLITLLVFPVRLKLNSDKKKFYIEMPFYFRVQLVIDASQQYVQLRLCLIPITIDPIKRFDALKKSLPDRKKKQHRRKRPINIRAMASKIAKAFTIKKAYANIDTGDFPLNAQLIPVVQLFNNRNIHVEINFEDKINLDIDIFTRMYKLIWIGIINKYKS